MKYPALLALPVLMILDYYATVLGSVWHDRGYNRHFVSQHYELNPVWQRSIDERNWFNPRHLAFVVLASGGLIALLQRDALPNAWAEGFVGVALGTYAVLLGRHLGNLMIFRYFSNHPNEVTGTVSMAHPLLLAISGTQLAVALVPLVLVALLSGSTYAIGGAIGALAVTAMHLAWLRKARAEQQA